MAIDSHTFSLGCGSEDAKRLRIRMVPCCNGCDSAPSSLPAVGVFAMKRCKRQLWVGGSRSRMAASGEQFEPQGDVGMSALFRLKRARFETSLTSSTFRAATPSSLVRLISHRVGATSVTREAGCCRKNSANPTLTGNPPLFCDWQK